ncbi:hypothetical protein [Acinetobacter bouvetii]|nr:hypothetical protein [Acinetobacter bouvetii]
MKKLSTILTAAVFTMLSATAFACPKGMTMTGGTGPNHKGGKCVAAHTTKHHKANHEKKAEHKMMKEDKKAVPQGNMMHENKAPEKPAPKP